MLMRGTGLPTSPGQVEDLALWLPLIAVATAATPVLGFLVIGVTLIMWGPGEHHRRASGLGMRPHRPRRQPARRAHRPSGRSR
jgi:hypothetical protein